MNVTVDLVNASGDKIVPAEKDFAYWTRTTMERLQPDRTVCELSIRLVDEAESASLNSTYRNRPGATNVLSFPYANPMPDASGLLGDLAICSQLVKREAVQQEKGLQAHWAHLTVHGVLHLNGFDHEHSGDAVIMEKLEVSILNSLGFDDPYE